MEEVVGMIADNAIYQSNHLVSEEKDELYEESKLEKTNPGKVSDYLHENVTPNQAKSQFITHK